MTGKADFTEDQWKLVLEAPPSAGLIVVTAQKGGTFRETIAIAKAYAEARQEHGESELLDEITAAKPERTTPTTTRLRSSSREVCSICATPSLSSRRRPPRTRSATTGA